MATKGKTSRKGKRAINLRQEAFARIYVENGGNALNAALEAGYTKVYALSKSYLMADNNGIRQMIAKYRAIQDEKFNFTVGQKKAWLMEIIEAGMETKKDSEGNITGRQALPASNQAIDIMNKMDGHYKEDNKYQVESTGTHTHTLTIEESIAILTEAGIDHENLKT